MKAEELLKIFNLQRLCGSSFVSGDEPEQTSRSNDEIHLLIYFLVIFTSEVSGSVSHSNV